MLHAMFEAYGTERAIVAQSADDSLMPRTFMVRCLLDGLSAAGDGPTLAEAALEFLIDLGGLQKSTVGRVG
ncbi:hypothetical protein Srot_2382 [Segniliparus rotundus DSM 44985]|uniref:Uncharacterized protein n=1 Tax=Segniliparus rotundus (strain ATCC BAA-972 / CDC 1076 / CIP 108378 / DSM 44985 / JCM 13578) TaxID=640132 RepID=D6ZAU0_SEGRD|nr:hypothetical protein [Segniliparus rotundus]ADG98826.1 hypothetical protein Srot_2382 [Segniliparus rotundus DSM 44985]